MTLKKNYLIASVVIALLLCLAQIMGSKILILACLGGYLLLVGWACAQDYTLPILLFFLPWSPIMRLSPTDFSFYTFGMVLICCISIMKKRLSFRKYQIKAGIWLLFLTLLSKLLDGSSLAFAYMAFMMMIVLFPAVKEESDKEKYGFLQVVIFFSIGIIIASLCAMNFAGYSNIRKYITVHEYLTIVRRCGFYGDPNFYTAQVLAALSGALALILQEKKTVNQVFLVILFALLMYCGMLSGSKSFAIVAAILILLWIVAIFKMKGRAGLKFVLIVFLIIGAVFFATSVVFSGLIQVIVTRFSATKDLNSFTTGRVDLWLSYFRELFGEIKVFFLGKGLTNIKVNGRGSHNSIIQMVYQVGMLGMPIMIYWIVCFWRESFVDKKRMSFFDIKILMILIGCFFPWMAIDILFFDEFFLLQWYALLAMISAEPIVKQQTMEQEKTVRMEGIYGRK